MPEPEAGAVAVATSDTATPSAGALPSTETVEPTPADSGIVEGQPADDATTSTPTPGSDEPAEDDGEKTELDESALTDKERKLPRRERERIARERATEQRIAAERSKWEADQKREADARARQEQAAEAQRKRQERFAAYLGVPDAPDKPGTITTLRSEIDAISRQIDAELVTPQGADLDALVAQKTEKQARVERLTEANGMATEIEGHVWDAVEADFLSAAGFPEFADDKARSAYIRHPGGIRGALGYLRQTIIAAKDAEWQAKVDAQARDAKAKHDAMTSDRNAWRARAGGSEDAPMQDGTPVSSGNMTRAAFLALPKEQKDKIRREQPSLVAEIYSRSA